MNTLYDTVTTIATMKPPTENVVWHQKHYYPKEIITQRKSRSGIPSWLVDIVEMTRFHVPSSLQLSKGFRIAICSYLSAVCAIS